MQTPVSDLELRKFGFILSAFIVGAFGIIPPLLFNKPLLLWPWIIAVILFVPALIKPNCLKIVHGPWMKLGHGLGWINTRLILGVIFFVFITPFGIIMRLSGKDPMAKKFDKSKESYRKITHAQPIQHMEKPY